MKNFKDQKKKTLKKNDGFQMDRTFDFSAAFKRRLFQASDILWIPDHHWTQAAVEKVAVVLARFLLFIPKPNPFVSSGAKKNPPSRLKILSSPSGPNVLALHVTVMKLQRATVEA